MVTKGEAMYVHEPVIILVFSTANIYSGITVETGTRGKSVCTLYKYLPYTLQCRSVDQGVY